MDLAVWVIILDAMPQIRDPVSEQFDAAAARLIRRADAQPGKWTGTYLAPPSPAWLAWGRRHSINLLGPDTAGRGQARTRWCRAFIRSVYYLHRWHYWEGRGLDLSQRRDTPNHSCPVTFEVGGVRLGQGGRIMGRHVRIKMHRGGPEAARDAVRALPDSRRIFDDSGHPAGAWSDPGRRDWT